MNLKEIKAAVDAGKKVYWFSKGYQVSKLDGDYVITRSLSLGKLKDNPFTKLTNDGKTLNGREDDFFIDDKPVNEKLISTYEEFQNSYRD